LRAVGATVDLCDRAGKPLIFVVNAATPKAKITYEAAVALSQHGTVAPVTLHHRTDFAASMIDGRTVMEVDPNGRSAREVTELGHISDRLEKHFVVPRRAEPAPASAVVLPARVPSVASAAAHGPVRSERDRTQQTSHFPGPAGSRGCRPSGNASPGFGGQFGVSKIRPERHGPELPAGHHAGSR
jgi:hypothetical protein